MIYHPSVADFLNDSLDYTCQTCVIRTFGRALYLCRAFRHLRHGAWGIGEDSDILFSGRIPSA